MEKVKVEKVIDDSNVKGDYVLLEEKGFQAKVIVAYDSHGKYSSDNENSLLLMARYGEVEYFMMGDCGEICEKEIMNTEILPDIEVLKVGHHGSKHSSTREFLEKLLPEIAVISVGKNQYGHPAEEAIERIENAGAKILRTDIEGNIIIRTDGKKISFS